MKKILIGEKVFDKTIFDQKWYDETYVLPKELQVVEIEDEYFSSCIREDFDFIDNTYTFNIDKYNARKEQAKQNKELLEKKHWFNTKYTIQEQKLRRLRTLNKLCDDGSNPEDELIKLYEEAETIRNDIQNLEENLNDKRSDY